MSRSSRPSLIMPMPVVVWRCFSIPWSGRCPKSGTVYRLDHLIGLPVDTTFALSRLALGGFFDKYPNLKIIAAHVGGAIPFLARRIERAFREGKSQHKPSHYFGQLFYDTAGPTDEAIVPALPECLAPSRLYSAPIIRSDLARKASNTLNMRSGSSQRLEGLSEQSRFGTKIYGGNARHCFCTSSQADKR